MPRSPRAEVGQVAAGRLALVGVQVPLFGLAEGAQHQGALVEVQGPDVLPVVGDGIIDCGEACDGNNTNDCDGCKGDCTRADNVCGDGIVECGETCDDGAVLDGDGCSASCIVEFGWYCQGSPSACVQWLATVQITAGGFQMGSPTSEEGRFSGETLHTVTLTHDFEILRPGGPDSSPFEHRRAEQ